jgi:hypothetical protein
MGRSISADCRGGGGGSATAGAAAPTTSADSVAASTTVCLALPRPTSTPGGWLVERAVSAVGGQHRRAKRIAPEVGMKDGRTQGTHRHLRVTGHQRPVSPRRRRDDCHGHRETGRRRVSRGRRTGCGVIPSARSRTGRPLRPNARPQPVGRRIGRGGGGGRSRRHAPGSARKRPRDCAALAGRATAQPGTAPGRAPARTAPGRATAPPTAVPGPHAHPGPCPDRADPGQRKAGGPSRSARLRHVSAGRYGACARPT